MDIQVAKKLFRKLKELKKQDRIFVDGEKVVLERELNGIYNGSKITKIAYVVLCNITEELNFISIADVVVEPKALDEYILLVEEFLEVFAKTKKIK
jgi:hypothetical protein